MFFSHFLGRTLKNASSVWKVFLCNTFSRIHVIFCQWFGLTWSRKTPGDVFVFILCLNTNKCNTFIPYMFSGCKFYWEDKVNLSWSITMLVVCFVSLADGHPWCKFQLHTVSEAWDLGCGMCGFQLLEIYWEASYGSTWLRSGCPTKSFSIVFHERNSHSS